MTADSLKFVIRSCLEDTAISNLKILIRHVSRISNIWNFESVTRHDGVQNNIHSTSTKTVLGILTLPSEFLLRRNTDTDRRKGTEFLGISSPSARRRTQILGLWHPGLASCPVLDNPVLSLATNLEDEEIWLILRCTTTVRKRCEWHHFWAILSRHQFGLYGRRPPPSLVRAVTIIQ